MTKVPDDAVIVVINDLHCGSPFAVAPARWRRPEGNLLPLNELQLQILEHYVACWQRVHTIRRGARLIVVVAGDAVEGLHHGSTQTVISRIDTQEAMAVAVIESGLQIAKFNPAKGDSIRFVSGSDPHDGQDGQSMERIARAVLDLDPQDSTRASSNIMQMTVNGVRFDVTHKPGSGPGTRNHTQGNAFTTWLKSLYDIALESGKQPPRYIITAHHHGYLRRDAYRADGNVAVTGYIAPAWKIKDNFVHQVAPFALSNIGMLAFEVAANGRVTEHNDWRITIEQDQVEEL